MFNPNELNEEQLFAATSNSSNILLAAGPGSGKTHTMTSRILYLIENRSVDPSSILVITFTKDAAIGMQKRFNAKSGLPLPVAFGTFHSIFYNMIKDHKKSSQPVIFYDRNKTKIASGVVRKYLKFEHSRDFKTSVQEFLNAVSMYKNTLDQNKAEQCLSDRQDNELNDRISIRDCFTDMFRYYENIRRKSNLMDFDDMVYDCMNLLLYDKSFKKKWQNRFTHILIDEFQDINKAQYETVKLLSGDKTSIFAVGDDDQSIYGFRGSDPTILKTFLEEKKADLMHLNSNYRSEKSIVDASVLIIDENKNRIPKCPVSIKDTNSQNVFLKGFDEQLPEYNEILEIISDKKNSCVVLFRTNIEMQTFASFLSSKDIPYRIREKTASIFDHFIMKDLFAYLQAVYGDTPEEYINEIINKPPRYIDHEYLIKAEGDLNALIKILSSSSGKGRKQEKINKIKALIKDLDFMKKLSVKSSLIYICKKIGYEKYIYSGCSSEDKKCEYQKILDEALRMFDNAQNMEDIISVKEKYEEGLSRSKKKQIPDAVDLMTVHASKGLEFRTVIIPDINEGNFPHGKMPDAESVEEERRIFYVAITRAEENLYLFYQNGKENGKTIPGRFLTPLIKNISIIMEKPL